MPSFSTVPLNVYFKVIQLLTKPDTAQDLKHIYSLAFVVKHSINLVLLLLAGFVSILDPQLSEMVKTSTLEKTSKVISCNDQVEQPGIFLLK